jgi:hypothetical protein
MEAKRRRHEEAMFSRLRILASRIEQTIADTKILYSTAFLTTIEPVRSVATEGFHLIVSSTFLINAIGFGTGMAAYDPHLH